MKYELTIKELEPYTEEEMREKRNGLVMYAPTDKPYHEKRVLYVEVSDKEFQEIKKAVMAIM